MTRKSLAGVIGVGVLAQLLLFVPLSDGIGMLVQALVAFVFAGLAPGTLLVEILVGRGEARPTLWERALLSIAAAFGVMVIVSLLASYLPGGLQSWQTMIAFDIVLIVLGAAALWRAREALPAPTSEWAGMNHGWLLVGVLVLLVVGATVRLANLGYADFQGDEARAALRAAAVIQGYDDVLMLHKKGPTEILLPTVIYSLTGHLNEATARLPFALASLAAIFAAWLLGWRVFGPLAGWLAALFIALDGYFIGFARIVQYQSIVLLMSLLSVYILVRLWQRKETSFGALAGWLSLAALLLATGTLSHYEGILAALPALFLLVMLIGQRRAQWRAFVAPILIALAVGGAALAVFYLPYILNERFAATYTYLTDRRIGSSFPYNNLQDVFIRTTLYSTTYAVMLLIVAAVAAMIRTYVRGYGRTAGGIMSVVLLAVVAVTFWNPAWFTIGGSDWIILPIGALLALAALAPRLRTEESAIWIWFAAVLVLALFLTEKPRTHVYTFFMPWMLLAGGILARGWQWLAARWGARPALVTGFAAASLFILMATNYAWAFFDSRSEVMLNYDTSRPAGYWTAYEEPDDKARFGFPLNNGWKVIGELFRTGVLEGNFDTSEKEAWVPAWYGQGVERCPRDAEYYFEIRNLEPFSNEDFLAMEHYLRSGFEKVGLVEVGGVNKMTIYQRTGLQQEYPTQQSTDGLPVYRYEDYASAFDSNALPDLPLTYPSVDPEIANLLSPETGGINFGNQIRLEGYALEYPQPLRPGDTIELTLYWRGQQPIGQNWKVFNQVIYGDGPMIAQRDGYPVCDGRETWRWDPGELITDVYRLPVAADAPDGLYPLNTGMYIEETGERLPILDENGVEVGTQYHIADIRVGEE